MGTLTIFLLFGILYSQTQGKHNCLNIYDMDPLRWYQKEFDPKFEDSTNRKGQLKWVFLRFFFYFRPFSVEEIV